MMTGSKARGQMVRAVLLLMIVANCSSSGIKRQAPPDAAADVAVQPSVGTAGATGGTSGSPGGLPGRAGDAGSTGPLADAATTEVDISCGALTSPANGAVSTPSLAYGSTAVYSCSVGYQLAGQAQRTCQSDGTWTGLAPRCDRIDCGALVPPAKGSVIAPATSYGSTANYACDPGYVPSGSATRVCQSDGTWTGATPECVETNCLPLAEPTFGTVSATMVTHPPTATYACLVGYRLVGQETRACQPDGTWTGEAPTCIAVECGPLSAPSGGSVSVNSTTSGWVATYSCLADHALFGNTTRTCQASGSWSGTDPACCANGETACSGRCVVLETDNANCGACGRPCSAVAPSTAQCIAGRCLVTLASRAFPPFHIAVDATSVYWSDSTSVMKVPIDGGTPTTLVSGQNDIKGLAVDAASLYWTDYAKGNVMKVALAGGTPTTLASGQGTPGALTLDATYVYWTSSSAIMKVPLGGGTPSLVASGQPSPSVIAVDATSVYWTNPPTTPLIKAPLAGGASTALVKEFTNTRAIAVDGSHLYWTGSTLPNTGFVMKVPMNGGATTTLASGQGLPWGIAIDTSNVYWTNNGSGNVMKMPLAGGTPAVLASGQNLPTEVVVDATSVYWLDQFGAVRKITPK